MSNAKNNKQSLQGKECFSRMNFLLQASQLMAGRNNVLSSYYGKLCRSIGKKAVLRCAPDVKRSLCKRCSLAQHPGLTADLSVAAPTPRRRKRKKPVHNVDANAQLQLTCRKCGSQRHFCVNSDYGFWLENPASVAEAFTLAGKTSTTAETTRTTSEEALKSPLNAARNKKSSRFKKNNPLETRDVCVGDGNVTEVAET